MDLIIEIIFIAKQERSNYYFSIIYTNLSRAIYLCKYVILIKYTEILKKLFSHIYNNKYRYKQFLA